MFYRSFILHLSRFYLSHLLTDSLSLSLSLSVVCEDCDEIYDGDCPIHGPLRTLDTSVGWDKDSLTYTSVPVPAQMTVKTSDIVNAGQETTNSINMHTQYKSTIIQLYVKIVWKIVVQGS